MRHVVSGMVFALGAATPILAQDVRITPQKDSSSFVLNGQSFTIARIQDSAHELRGEFTRTSRECPPFCIQPMIVSEGVRTVGELEVLAFLEDTVASGRGLLIDSRVPDWFAKGSIPGAVNVPFPTLSDENPYRDDILRALGAVPTDAGGLDFTDAFELVLFCNGPWCEQAPIAVRNLIAAVASIWLLSSGAGAPVSRPSSARTRAVMSCECPGRSP